MSFRNYKKNIKTIELEQKKKAEWRKAEQMIIDAIAAMEKHRDEYIAKAKQELENGNSSQYNTLLSLLKEMLSNIVKANDILKNLRIALELRESQKIDRKLIKSIDSVLKDICETEMAFRAGISQKLFDSALLLQSNNATRLMELLKNNNYPYSDSFGSFSSSVDDEVRMLAGEKNEKDQRSNNILFENETGESPEVVQQNEKGERQIDLPLQTHESTHQSIENSVDTPTQTNMFTYNGAPYNFPTLDLLNDIEDRDEIRERNERDIINVIQVLEDKFRDFGIEVKTERYTVGAAFSRLELRLISNTPLSQIARIEKDINMAVKRDRKSVV